MADDFQARSSGLQGPAHRDLGSPSGPHYNFAVFVLLIAFAVSLLSTLLVIHAAKTRGRFFLDHDLSGPQKFHAQAVPRVGGMGIVAGLVLAWPAVWAADAAAGRLFGLLLLCGVPAFAVGLIEDLTKRVSPRSRLVATAVSAALALWLLQASLTRTDIPGRPR